MTTDAPDVIHSGEIWLKSQCQVQEEQLVGDIYTCLQQYCYQNLFELNDLGVISDVFLQIFLTNFLS